MPPSHDQSAGATLLITPVSRLIAREPVCVPAGARVAEAAQTMERERVSCVMVTEGDRLQGIVTDRDLRNRVIARGLGYDTPVSEVMSREPATIDASGMGYQALSLMGRRGIHHLPVLRAGAVAGMITTTDLIQRLAVSPLGVIEEVYHQDRVEDLAASAGRLGQVLVSLVDANATANGIGHALSGIGEAINVRLLQLAEAELGPPPVACAWLSGGSLARREQTARSDQDNCLLLADDYDPARHGAYFERLSHRVCEALDACDYVYCPGEVMAMTPKWRQPLAVWRGYFDAWIDQPEPKALMLACIFFDLRCLYGEASLLARLQGHVLAKARGNRIFLAYMASNALSHRPPLGLLRRFTPLRGGEHAGTLDLKHNGVIPITDLARVYALSAGIEAVNTWQRLEAAGGRGELSADGAAELTHAMDSIGALRLRHQARQLREGRRADNYAAPSALSRIERRELKEAFAAVRAYQATLAQRYQLGRFG